MIPLPPLDVQPPPCRSCMTTENHTGIEIHIDRRRSLRTVHCWDFEVPSSASSLFITLSCQQFALFDFTICIYFSHLLGLRGTRIIGSTPLPALGPATQRAFDLPVLLHGTRWSHWDDVGAMCCRRWRDQRHCCKHSMLLFFRRVGNEIPWLKK